MLCHERTLDYFIDLCILFFFFNQIYDVFLSVLFVVVFMNYLISGIKPSFMPSSTLGM